MQYLDSLESKVTSLGFTSIRKKGAHSNILSFQIPSRMRIQDLITSYAKKGITVTGPDGLLRIAPHWCNNIDEQEYFIQSTLEILH